MGEQEPDRTGRPAGGPASTLHPDRWTEPFWAAARRHVLVVALCVDCGTPRPVPPGPYCWECDAQDVVWSPLPGTGKVFTYTVVRQVERPYAIAVVELDGVTGVRLMSDLVGVDPETVGIGMPVEVWWDDVDATTTIPRFAVPG
ncbi:hypothetical protein UG55_100887 [Frankia sp. EI5c]|uniref:Zn-ribbon domain-containing OB-fold protein n=1 Tax=Frankia sp. EI5c TaxID=683316 RepID=UPI0007C26E8A|nr:OB-fold domain-containing protein [Frankia sp. EI5c]OAA27436.1 hypothetical protein UG55_100887 [Frankia sp. EI5c]